MIRACCRSANERSRPNQYTQAGRGHLARPCPDAWAPRSAISTQREADELAAERSFIQS
jgi:hypothetical protein